MSLSLHILVIIVALTLSAGLGSPIVRLAFRLARVPDTLKAARDSSTAAESPNAGDSSTTGEFSAAGASPAAGEAPASNPDQTPCPSAKRAPALPPAETEILLGGRMIGILERLAITGLLLAGYPAGIAAIVAIKGLGRFHELRGPHGALASEKFVIGTLASYLWAGLAAVGGIWARVLL